MPNEDDCTELDSMVQAQLGFTLQVMLHRATQHTCNDIVTVCDCETDAADACMRSKQTKHC